MKAFRSIPFLRILLPFTLGLLSAIVWPSLLVIKPLILLVMFLLTLGIHLFLKSRNSYKWLFMIMADVFLFTYANFLVFQNNASNDPKSYTHVIKTDTSVRLIAVVKDLPIKKEKFTRCELEIKKIELKSGFQNVNGTSIAYFRNSFRTDSIKSGQVLLIATNFQNIQPPQNPFEFDYKKYLYYKNIYHTLFVDSAAFRTLQIPSTLSFVWELGLRCKGHILTRLRSSNLSKDAFSICSALLTGYDDEIDTSVMESFSHSGTLHVLSVSGLHTGLIYLVLNFLFHWFDPKNKYKNTRFLLVTLCLWFFALITGFSAPVLRAVIMFNLLGIGKIYFRNQRYNQLNILLVSAFLLLCYKPFYIMDVGFLLSYFALFGLIYFQPGLSLNWTPQNPILKYLWESTVASFAATISTLPITLFCFKQFPIWFFVCNIVVVPATFLILFLALFVVLKLNVVAIVINGIISTLIWFIDLFNTQNIGFIDNIHFTFTDAILLSILIAYLSVAIQYRSYSFLRNGLFVVIGWQFISLLESYRAKTISVLVVYAIKGESAPLLIKNKQEVYLNPVGKRKFNYHVKPHLHSFNYPCLKYLPFNYIKKGNQQILVLAQPGCLPEIDLTTITILVISNNFVLREQDFFMFKNLKMLVITETNRKGVVKQTEKLSRKFNVGFCDVKRVGCFLQSLP